jgi:hypothetical protein
VTGKVAGSQQSTIKIPVMPYISYHTVTETQQQLKVIIEYKVSIDKGMTEYEGIISCSLKAPSRRRSTTSHYGFSFMRDHSWRYVGGMEIFECSGKSQGHDPLPVLQEVLYMVALYEHENN